jgi:methylmalonyl-CoA mutase N-terminal domain/subunit
MRIITDTFAFCSKKVPFWNTISISGYHMREAGCTAVQEVAFTLSNAISYVQSALDAGLGIDEFGPRLAFFFCCHQDFFEEVAKFRAARRLWAEIMKNRFKAVEPRSMMLRFHTQTAGCSLTAQQPKNNIMRVAFQALAAVLGGTQSLHTNSMDEALCLPTEESVRIALRTQQVIANELGVTNTIDPMAGSYYMESLTRRIYEEATDYIKEIDKMGGSVAAIERGYIQKEIQNAAWAYQKEVERQSRIVVGVNKFTMDEDPQMELMRVDPAVRTAQIERLERLKARRDATAVKKALEALENAACGSDNLVPYIYDAVKAYGTLGEICGVLRKVFGEFQQSGMLG